MRTKRFIFSIIALAIAMAVGAQNEMSTAILQSGETVTMFTGIDALINAHTAANDGDVITLSAGKFNGTTISKSVSIYGAGFETDASIGTDITEVYGLTIGKEGSTLSGVHIEGMLISGTFNVGGTNANAPLAGLQVVKVKMNSSQETRIFSDMVNALFSQCIFLYVLRGYPDANNVQGTIAFNNCYFASDFSYFKTGCILNIDHCIVGSFTCSSSNISNSIVYKIPGNNYNPVYNNIVSTFDNYWNGTNWYNVSQNQIFADVESNYFVYSPERTFKIQQPDVWQATDGTEIGIRGGDGWSKAPSTPVLKNLRTRVDGATLQVDYQAVPR